MEHLKEIPFLDKYPIFRKLAAIGDLQKLTPEERDFYEEDVKIMRDLYATDKWEKEKRRMEREAACREKETAADNAKLAIAQKLLSLELPLLQIMEATGLTQEQIKGLQK